MNTKPHQILFISSIFVSFIAGLTGGYVLSPSYQMTMYSKQTMGFGQADFFVDLRYINLMAAHHRGAMLLAEGIQHKTTRPELKTLAAEILKNEPVLIEELYTWKRQWYKDPRTAPDPVVANMGSADATVDLRFLNALIAHHEEGIGMTKEIRLKSSRSEILNNADAVEQFLKQSKTQLELWRKTWYNI
jgi:uncharacterized protein (DUF305 family)